MKKKFAICALVAGSEMSNFWSENVTKHCAHGLYLTTKNEIDALVSGWEMSKFGILKFGNPCELFLDMESGLQFDGLKM